MSSFEEQAFNYVGKPVSLRADGITHHGVLEIQGGTTAILKQIDRHNGKWVAASEDGVGYLYLDIDPTQVRLSAVSSIWPIEASDYWSRIANPLTYHPIKRT